MIEPGKGYPDFYLHVLECRSGETWIMPLRGSDKMDLIRHTRRWIKQEFRGELFLDPPMQPGLEGDFYAKLMTDSRPPDSCICWEGAGFWLTDNALAGLARYYEEKDRAAA